MRSSILRIAVTVAVVSLLVLGLRPETGAIPTIACTPAMAAYTYAVALADFLPEGEKRGK